jgi:hypothetical protein
MVGEKLEAPDSSPFALMSAMLSGESLFSSVDVPSVMAALPPQPMPVPLE